jgi:hypothetical protein
VCIYNKIAEAIKNTKSFFHLVRLSTSTAKPLRRGRLQSHVLHLQRPGRGLPAKNHVTSGYATTPALTGRDNHGTENETKIRAVAKRRAPCAVQAKHRQPIRPGLEHGIGSGRRAQRKLPCTGGTGGTRAAGLVTEEKKGICFSVFHANATARRLPRPASNQTGDSSAYTQAQPVAV